ncbi:hypothetical protein IH575_01860 [Candidatus Dojkabacteria bacterium]|nr:hypothetical protein [Candidatus Dojkabacteria bacterium]
MSQTSKVGKVATSIITDGITTRIRYHNTTVVTFSGSQVMLNSGGWKTNTTKLRMNQASNQFNLRFSVYQKDYQWYVVVNYDWNNPIPFTDYMVIERGA